jgi:hypothetical protein
MQNTAVTADCHEPDCDDERQRHRLAIMTQRGGAAATTSMQLRPAAFAAYSA